MRKEPHLLKLDFLKRKYFDKFELRTKICTSMLLFINIAWVFKQKAALGLDNLYYKGSITRPKPRCFITARAYGLDNGLMMSRFTLRRLANAGYVTDFKRASW